MSHGNCAPHGMCKTSKTCKKVTFKNYHGPFLTKSSHCSQPSLTRVTKRECNPRTLVAHQQFATCNTKFQRPPIPRQWGSLYQPFPIVLALMRGLGKLGCFLQPGKWKRSIVTNRQISSPSMASCSSVLVKLTRPPITAPMMYTSHVSRPASNQEIHVVLAYLLVQLGL